MKPEIVMLAAAVAALAGCASPTPYYDTKYGLAVSEAKHRQTINPDASRNTDPAAGMDGVSAQEAVGRYQDSFKAPERTFEIMTGTR